MTQIWRFLNCILICLLFIGCEEPAQPYNPPGAIGYNQTLDIPQAYRVKNYTKKGSCVYASTSCSLHTQHKHDLAKWVRSNYSGGANSEDVMEIYDKAGLKYSYGEGMNFLREVHKSRFSSLIGWPYGHVVNFVGIDENYVYILDNNQIEEYKAIPIDRFRQQWQGWCIALAEKSIPPSLIERKDQ